jgi:hypothetical protein
MLTGLLAVLALAASVHADDAPPPSAATQPDDELIEFLGTVGSEDEDWISYLSQTDPTKVATAKNPPSDEGKKDD